MSSWINVIMDQWHHGRVTSEVNKDGGNRARIKKKKLTCWKVPRLSSCRREISSLGCSDRGFERNSLWRYQASSHVGIDNKWPCFRMSEEGKRNEAYKLGRPREQSKQGNTGSNLQRKPTHLGKCTELPDFVLVRRLQLVHFRRSRQQGAKTANGIPSKKETNTLFVVHLKK